MKKLLFSFMATGLLATTLISCQSNQKGTQETGADSTQTITVEDSSKTAAAAATTNGSELLKVSPNVKLEAPQFSNEDVNNGFTQFEPIKQEYMAAINANDAAKIKEVTAKYNSWIKNAATWGSKLTKDENQMYIDHYTKLVTQWDKLSLKLKK
ncbi:MAG: hypothetical protein H7202_04075 [Pedobacter sp.]|nr:hypothetical protein [Pedobacter sp.]